MIPLEERDRPGSVEVWISTRSLWERFHGCTPEYIREVCKGACCRSSTGPARVAILPADIRRIEAGRSAQVPHQLGVLEPRPEHPRACRFQEQPSGLCNLHAGGLKPSPCIISPFGLTSRRTLFVKNRYKLLRCYQAEPRLPAFVAFRSSLEHLFGEAEAGRIIRRLEEHGPGETGDRFVAAMLEPRYREVEAIAAIRRLAKERAREAGIQGVPSRRGAPA